MFGLFFGGIPLLMMVVLLVGNNGPGLVGRLAIAAFLSLFVLVGGSIFFFGLTGSFGSRSLLLRRGRITKVFRIFVMKIPVEVEVEPSDTVRIMAARTTQDALSGLVRIVLDRSDGPDIDLVERVEESAARAIVDRIRTEVDVAVATESEEDVDASEPVDDVAVAPVDREERRSDVVLEAEQGYGHWRGLLVAAVIVDSIMTTVFVVLFLTGAVESFVLWMFLGAFVLVAMVLTTVAVRHALVAMKLGPAQVTLSVTPLLLGETFSISYEQQVKSSCDVESVRVRLFLKETARYRRGTNTYTVRHESFEVDRELVPAVKATRNFKLQGTAEFAIPTNSMHTFEASNNWVDWMLEVKVVIRKWPDATYAFKCMVLPYAYVEAS